MTNNAGYAGQCEEGLGTWSRLPAANIAYLIAMSENWELALVPALFVCLFAFSCAFDWSFTREVTSSMGPDRLCEAPLSEKGQ